MSLFGILGALKGLVSVKKNQVDVVNITFRLHRFTAVALVACSILVTGKQLFGENIHCMVPSPMDGKMFESFCFMKSTFTLPPPQDTKVNSRSYVHRGVTSGEHREDEKNVFHNYYQWVCFTLFLQAAAYYLPYRIWKHVEGGRVGKLLAEVDTNLLTEKPLEEQVEGVSRYLAAHGGWFNKYAGKFLLCQLALLVNVVGQMYLMDIFLGGQFLHYGISILSGDSSPLAVMEQVFPKVTKCSMKTFGVSGKVVNHAGLCTLPINIINEKIYVFLWFWFIAVAVWTILHTLWQLLVLVLPWCRFAMLRNSAGSCSPPLLSRIVQHSSYGDFILLMLISQNVEVPQFMALLAKLGDRLGVRHGTRTEDYHSVTLPSYTTVDKNDSMDVRMRKV